MKSKADIFLDRAMEIGGSFAGIIGPIFAGVYILVLVTDYPTGFSIISAAALIAFAIYKTTLVTTNSYTYVGSFDGLSREQLDTLIEVMEKAKKEKAV